LNNKLNAAGLSDTGRVRSQNEDAWFADVERGLFIVADGLGGQESGGVASTIVVESVAEAVRAGGNLVDALAGSHRAILTASQQGRGKPGMASTGVALQLKGNQYEVAWVGDSRAYLWDQSLHLLTKDHTYVQRLVDEGEIDVEEARMHPDRSFLTRALGAAKTKDVSIDSVTGHFFKNNQIMLCSDGLTGEVSDKQIANILEKDINEQAKVEQLVQLALDSGGSDNITALLISSFVA